MSRGIGATGSLEHVVSFQYLNRSVRASFRRARGLIGPALFPFRFTCEKALLHNVVHSLGCAPIRLCHSLTHGAAPTLCAVRGRPEQVGTVDTTQRFFIAMAMAFVITLGWMALFG